MASMATFHLCFPYNRSLTKVSYAPPAYYADRLCERGRLYLQRFHKDRTVADDADDAVVQAEVKQFFCPNGYGIGDRRNPWDEAHDGKMFWGLSCEGTAALDGF